jgi:hypothetical protein
VDSYIINFRETKAVNNGFLLIILIVIIYLIYFENRKLDCMGAGFGN